MNSTKRFLITGINGQIGRGLSKELIKIYGSQNVFLSDLDNPDKLDNFSILDVTNRSQLRDHIFSNKINKIIHLASIRSHDCELNTDLAKKVNIDGLHNILEVSKEAKCL
jgi:threonine 3-dehydrogenase